MVVGPLASRTAGGWGGCYIGSALLSRVSRDNNNHAQVATMDTTPVSHKDLGGIQYLPHGSHAYHEGNHVGIGLHLDSTKALWQC